jgi:hypothetical protein
MKRVVLALSLAAALLVGCAEDANWIARVEQAHSQADAAAARGDLESARATLRALSEQGLPSTVAAEDRRRVEQDIFFRRAALALQAGDAADAQRLATAGLALGSSDDAFSVNLWVVRGRAREKLGLTEPASEDYHRALRANETLLTQALRGSGDSEDTDQPKDSE